MKLFLSSCYHFLLGFISPLPDHGSVIPHWKKTLREVAMFLLNLLYFVAALSLQVCSLPE